jgi:hypothetical protein
MKISAKTIFFSRLKGTFLKGSVFHRELLTSKALACLVDEKT